ncbi:transmembrane sensor [Parabacteroides sp. PF5-5]|uniref:FecR domain-containing protein n=1 Tax=unclassified Parabacteroides TaxID=2649774 RepID=UPI002474CA8C|nr:MULTISPECIES: FecR domain-containing protein [unclassified Parabacteroides]MDH6305452.1 transmembrane sensor [Parabacteroides sp. PH5-39]MDH6316162.1 transmembrane sensor [Parabacteroides sp. PF5-13]MDH6320312.1 transmembrane sensor [Parabacteroides sp. PH5-13]MDH6324042.1 transmembrane sensor [Parabacteroides sp. PH5-8]MDH6327353.1 transmembrane sensor [Parabacteroides sp. PH5-41]
MEKDKTEYGQEMSEELNLLAYIQGNATAAETTAIEEWLKLDPSHEEELLQIAHIYYAQRAKDRIDARDPLLVFRKIEQKIRGRKRRIWLNRIAVAAACIAGVIILSTVLSKQTVHTPEVTPQLITIQSNPGMRTYFNLPDNSMVYLNAGSTVSYTIPFQDSKRAVSLSGEAYFKVTPDAERPFIVNTFDNKMSVKVLGTEFNVEAYSSDQTAYTTLVEGKVSILLQNENGVTTEHLLKPSQKGTYNLKTNSFQVKDANTELETGWMNGKVIFKDTPLPEVLRKLSHFYDVEFQVTDKVIETYLFTGTFNNRQLGQVLEYLKISSGIEYSFTRVDKDDSEGINRQKIILRKKK